MKDQAINLLRYVKRFATSFYGLNKNKALGRSFVPDPRWRLFLETVSFCNLLCKFCTYPKNLHPRTIMDDAVFHHCIDQAAAMGFRQIVLTPINGDVFMDNKAIERMKYIQDSKIKSFLFYTNFIGADEDKLSALLAMPKLESIEISIYGHDLESFCNITGRGKTQYRRLIANLNDLERLWGGHPRIGIAFRTYRSFDLDTFPENELLAVVKRLRNAGIFVGKSSMADNWGGDIDKTDIADIEMTLINGRYFYRKGPCALPFDSVQITAEGRVNACACRDPRGSLTIGHLETTALKDILSTRNEKWMGIIAGHEAGKFNEVCASCGFYQSIYDGKREHGFPEVELMTQQKFFSLVEAESKRPDS